MRQERGRSQEMSLEDCSRHKGRETNRRRSTVEERSPSPTARVGHRVCTIFSHGLWAQPSRLEPVCSMSPKIDSILINFSSMTSPLIFGRMARNARKAIKGGFLPS